MNATEQYIYLTACAATGKQARLDEADFETLWDISRSHNMTALTAKGLLGTKALDSAPEAEQKRWKNALNNSVKKTMLFDAERKRIIAFLEERGIWYMPLKGAIINGLYKSYGTREFADNDILVDPQRTAEVRDYLLDRGYTFRTDDFSSDEYSKDPFYNFEIHRALIEDSTRFETSVNYYKNVKDRLIKDEKNAFGFHFTDDDFYIFFIFHAFKHYDNRGTGFRTVADEYVVRHSKQFHFDDKNIAKELDKLGIREFEQQLRSLADALFERPERTHDNIAGLSDEEMQMLTFTLTCDTFGSLENLFKKELQSVSGGSKAKYVLKRMFPPVSRFKYSNPFVYRHKIVYPFFLAYRMVANPIRHRRYLKSEIQAVKNTKN